MAITAAELLVKIGADVSGLDSGLTGAQKAMYTFGSVTRNVALAGIGALTAGAVAAGGALVKFTSDAAAAEKIQKQLNAVLKSTEGVSGMTADAVNDIATGLSKITPFEDDAIVSGENLLLTFTKIGKNVFPMATEMALNMSTALGQDLQSSAMQLGKALNEPIEGVSALRKVGVQLTDEMEAQVKQFMELGDVESAQRIILKELGTEFGNSARAAGETFTGQLTIAKNTLGNLGETIGTAILPSLTKLLEKFTEFAGRKDVQEFIENTAKSIGELAIKMVEFLDNVDWEGIATQLEAVGKWFSDIGDGTKSWKDLVAEVGGILNDVIAEITEWSQSPEAQKAFEDAGKAVGEILGEGIRVVLELAIASIGEWFSGGGFEKALKPEETGTSLANKLVEGLTMGFIKGLLGRDISQQTANWIKTTIQKALEYSNPAQIFTNYLGNAIMQAWGNISSLWNTSQGLNTNRGSTVTGGRASGGSVYAGQTYWVGERGPEPFTPWTSGTITSNAEATRKSDQGTQQSAGNFTQLSKRDIESAFYNAMVKAGMTA